MSVLSCNSTREVFILLKYPVVQSILVRSGFVWPFVLFFCFCVLPSPNLCCYVWYSGSLMVPNGSDIPVQTSLPSWTAISTVLQKWWCMASCIRSWKTCHFHLTLSLGSLILGIAHCRGMRTFRQPCGDHAEGELIFLPIISPKLPGVLESYLASEFTSLIQVFTWLLPKLTSWPLLHEKSWTRTLSHS